jgi:hypothetical protein
MEATDDAGPLYFVERSKDGVEGWRVMGPNGLVGDYQSETDAQAKADFLNEQAAEEAEDDS